MQLRDIAPDYGIASIVAVSVWFLKYLPVSYWIVLPLQLIVGLIVFILSSKICIIQEYQEVRTIVKTFTYKVTNRNNHSDSM